MFAEAIPGAVIQLSAILSAGEASSAAIVSLIISALTSGFISATISFDMDTDTMLRMNNPEFYGFVPDSAKRRTGELHEIKNDVPFAVHPITI